MKKYRPYLTLAELRSLSADCTNHHIKRYLDRFIRDIDDGFIRTAIETTDPMEIRLGMSPKEGKTSYDKEQERRYMNDEMSPEEEKVYELSQGVKL